MNKFIVAVDVDSIVNNLVERLIEVYNKKYDANFKLDDFNDYDFFKCLPYDDAQCLMDLLDEKKLWDSLSPRKGSQRGVKHFVDQGYEVYFATATTPVTFPWKVEWLKKYFGIVPEKNIICINNKGLLKADVLIDDNIDNLLSSQHYDRVCLDYPWNRNVHDEVYSIYRARSWDEIVDAVDKIYEINKKLYYI